jgi:hypothetical protein
MRLAYASCIYSRGGISTLLLLPVQLSTVRSERVLPEQGLKSTQTLKPKPKPKLKRTVNQNTSGTESGIKATAEAPIETKTKSEP